LKGLIVRGCIETEVSVICNPLAQDQQDAEQSVLQSSMTMTGQFHKARTWATMAPTVAASLWAGIRAMGRSDVTIVGIMQREA